ncbi:putative transcriptional regulator [Endobacter medicaginis]|uniref:UPF0301 protein FHR90_001020 n=2 Tax=Endobacter medicaginis TaxID=1181271 RepID=A0A839V0P9_9PROT|nr:putative transcriptional regulator [Endobacter medicaginis]
MRHSTASAGHADKSLLASLPDFAANSAPMTDQTCQHPGLTPHHARPAPAEEPMADLSGRLLVAMPALTTPPFAHSVIYLCAHSPQDGAMGLVINRRLSQPDFVGLMEQLGVEPVPPQRQIGLCAGGPVASERGFVLHSADWSGDGSLAVDEATTLTASLDVLRAIAAGEGPRRAMLALGHAAWSPGQLEDEIAANVWLSVPAEEAILFDRDFDTKWRRALHRVGVDPGQLVSGIGHA